MPKISYRFCRDRSATCNAASVASKSKVHEPSAATFADERRFRQRRHFCRTVSNMWTSEECGAASGGGVRNNQIRLRIRIQNDLLKPFPERRLINRQRFGVMKMAAGFLFRRAAGMENGGAFFRREAGQFQFLERAVGTKGICVQCSTHLRRQSFALRKFFGKRDYV